MVLGINFFTRLFGLDLKKVFNPDWNVVVWFLLVAFTAMNFKSVILSVDAPAPFDSFLGQSIGLLVTNPFTLANQIISMGVFQVVGGLKTVPVGLNLVVTLLNVVYWYVSSVYLTQFLSFGLGNGGKKK